MPYNKALQLTHKSVAPIVAVLLAPTELKRYVSFRILNFYAKT